MLEIKDVYKKLPEKTLGPINLNVQYGDRVLLLGNNGEGKSTLIKMITGQMKPDSGTIHLGTRISIGYLPQEEYFPTSSTVLEIFKKEIGIDESNARKTLNRFRITEEDLEKNIEDLSSGEYSRFILAIMMTKNPNFIILDEPSNHLDIEVLKELEEALIEFKGTLLIVSHDRYFIDKLKCNKIYVLDTILKPIFNYGDYQNQK